jgi:ABC-2 type transport system permease protein
MAVEIETQVAQRTVATPRSRTAHAGALRVIKVIWLREVLTYTRDRPRIISSLMMPILLLIIFGEGLGSSVGALAPGVSYREFVFPGVVAMTVLTGSVFSGMSIIWDKEFGFLREILVSPVSRSAIGVGKLLGGATNAMMQGLVMFIFAPIVGVHLSPLVIVELIAVLILMSLSLTAVGIALGSRLRSVESFQMVSQMTIMPAMFLSGIFFPINNVPAWMEVLTKVNPVTYAVSPVRRIALSDALPADAPDRAQQVVGIDLFGHTLTNLESLAILTAFGVVMLLFAITSFRRTE